jgi:hypothetical protein
MPQRLLGWTGEWGAAGAAASTAHSFVHQALKNMLGMQRADPIL